MRTEAELDFYIAELLKAFKIPANLQGTTNAEISAALKTASKNFTGKAGYPDITAVFEDFVLVMENKSDQSKEILREGNGISLETNAVKNYAVNGAIFYARKIIEGSSYKKIFAFGNVGDRTHHRFKPFFVGVDTIKELPAVETFVQFTAENIADYYNRAVLGKKTRAELELKEMIDKAGKLHERLRNYGQLGETEKPLVVAAILLALDDKLKPEELRHESAEIKNDGAIIFGHIETTLKRAEINDSVKRERVLDQFRLIKNRPLLNAVNENLDKTPLRAFTEFLEKDIYDAVKDNKSATDNLGIFYREFVRYSGGDGQTLGVVLTPPFITELFCDLVDLQVEDVVLDPCCGTGGFLLAAMSRMLSLATTAEQRAHIKSKQLHGIEIRDDMFSIATTSMILRGDGKSNLTCEDFFSKNPADLQKLGGGVTVGFMNPPYSQAKNDATKHLSELRFIERLLDSVSKGGRVAAIVPVSAMIGKTKDDKVIKRSILEHHTLKGVISLNKNTFYRIGVVPCIAVFEAGKPHNGKAAKFINFEDDGWELKKHEGYVETIRAKDRKQYLLDCWFDRTLQTPSKFMVKAIVEPDDEWLHSFYYYNDELPAEADFMNTVADYLTFEFNMIVHGRGYLFDSAKKNSAPLTDDVPPLEDKQWREFVIGDLFNIFLPSGDTQADKCESGKIPLISAGFNNNGVCKFINHGDDNSKIYGGNIISVDMFGKAFCHEYKFYSVSHGRINLLEAVKPLNRFQLKFITTAINSSARGKFSYNQMCSSKRIRKLVIQLPVNEAGEPDFDYMEKFIRLHDERLIQEYLDRIAPPEGTGGGDIVPLTEKEWRGFFIGDLFRLEAGKGKGAVYLENDSHGISYLGATNRNNAVLNFVKPVENLIQRGNCIAFIRNGEGSIGYSVYKAEDFIATSDITCGYADFLNKYVGWFITTVADKVRSKYNFNYKRSDTRLKRERLMLPVNKAGEPDFAYMEAFTRNQFAQLWKKYLSSR